MNLAANQKTERKNERIYVEIHAKVAGLVEGKLVSLALVDLSIQGARILAGETPEVAIGTDLELHLPIGGNRGDILCRAKVCWSRNDDQRGGIIGVSFDDEDTQETLRSYLYRREDRSGQVRQKRRRQKIKKSILKWGSLCSVFGVLLGLFLGYLLSMDEPSPPAKRGEPDSFLAGVTRQVLTAIPHEQLKQIAQEKIKSGEISREDVERYKKMLQK